MDSLAGLNEAQRRAVTTTEGYVRVVAGAGTGKTRTLTRRYGYLVEAGGVSPGHILAVTFTNKAANEMKQRVRSMVGDGDTGYICTFHALGLMILKEDLHTLGWPQNFLVLDEEDKNSLLRTVFEDMGMTLKEMSLHKAADLTDDMKWDLAYVPLLTGESDAPLLELIDREQNRRKQMFYRYLYEQRKIYALDFEDLVDLAVALLRQNQEVREKWARRFEYVMVDEFQDIDGKQYELADMLSSCHKNLFVVGDPDQTIYTWRGADVHFILDFPNRYPGCETVVLTENYRSTPQILAAANALIEKNQQRVERQLHAVNGPGPVPPYYHAKDVGAEAKFVVARLKELKAAGERLAEHGHPLPGPLRVPEPGGRPPPRQDPLRRLRGHGVLRPQGDQGRHLLPSDAGGGGRSCLCPGGERASTGGGQEADGLSAELRPGEGLHAVWGASGQSGPPHDPVLRRRRFREPPSGL